MIGTLLVVTILSGVVGTGLGGVLGVSLKKESKRTMGLLLSFAAGVMISLVCFDLLRDAAETETNPFVIALFVLLGAGIVHLLNFLIEKKAAIKVEDIGHRLIVAGIVMVIAIAFHNVPVGMTIGASTIQAHTVFNSTALTMAILIGIHNVPEGMAIAIPLTGGGMSKGKAVLITAFGGVPVVIGALLGYYLGDIGPGALALSLSFASGALMYVIFGEILPHAMQMDKSKMPTYAVLTGLITGLLITYL